MEMQYHIFTLFSMTKNLFLKNKRRIFLLYYFLEETIMELLAS